MKKMPPSEALLEGMDNLINSARRTWEDLSVERDQVYGVSSATFDMNANLAVLRIQNSDGTDGLVAITVDEYLLFALRLLNKRYESRLTTTLSPQGIN